MAKDPVCGMRVDEQHAPATSNYAGTTYYFCSPHCKQHFDKQPEHYVHKEHVPGAHRQHHTPGQ